MRVLVLDDPLGNLAAIEDRLPRDAIKVDYVRDGIEGIKYLSKGGHDAVVASAMSLAGEAIPSCLSFKAKCNGSVLVIVHAPYPISDDDMAYLTSIGIDHVIPAGQFAKIADVLISFDGGLDAHARSACTEFDSKRVMAITRSMYEAALRDMASKAMKLEEILENSSDVIYELDPYGRIILISKVIEKLTGYSRQELLGMSALEVTSPDSLDLVADHISMLLTGKEETPAVEVGVQAKDGRVIPAEMIVRPIRHDDKVVGILGIGRNVEERKRLEESVKRAINEKDFYLDLMAHDIQNFNQAIIGYLEMILATENLDPKLERYAKGAFRQVTQTAQLIAHLKKVSQVRHYAKQTVKRRDLKDVVQKSITNLQSRVDKSTVVITLDCREEECPVMASDDVDDLLDMLVTSLSRYSLSEMLHVKVALFPEVTNGVRYWAIDVSGTNMRIPEPAVRCVMSQDFTGCQTIERPDLQLLVMRAIVESQHGAIEARTNENGRGDRFVIRIPQA